MRNNKIICFFPGRISTNKAYRIVVMFKQKYRKFIEKLGFLNFCNKPQFFCLNFCRLGYWLNKGAILHKTVRKYLMQYTFINTKNELFP